MSGSSQFTIAIVVASVAVVSFVAFVGDWVFDTWNVFFEALIRAS